MSVTDLPSEEVTFYWIQGCGNCTRLKGYLTSRGVQFKAVNVQAHPEAVEELRRAGHRAFPVVRKGSKFVVGEIEMVDKLLGLTKDTRGRELSAEELVQRCAKMLDLASDLSAQLPAEHFDDQTPTMEDFKEASRFLADGTPFIPHGTYKTLIHHLAQHGVKALRTVLAADGVHELGFAVDGTGDYNFFGEPEPATPMYRVIRQMRLTASDLRAWLQVKPPCDLSPMLQTHRGERSMYGFLKTQAISCLQHTRQLAEVLGRLGIEPSGTVSAEDLEGLTMPAGIWD